MAKLGTLELSGASGNNYTFDVYPATTNWTDGVACIYYVSRRMENSDGTRSHSHIYVGETDDLKARLAEHHKQACFSRYGYNAISILQINDEDKRQIVEKDLIKRLAPPCND